MTKATKKYTDRELYTRLIQYLKPYKWRYVAAVLTSIPTSALEGSAAFAIGPFVDFLIKGENTEFIWVIPVFIITTFFLQSLFQYLSGYYTAYISTSIIKDLRSIMFSQLVQLDLSYFKKEGIGNIHSRYFGDPANLQRAIVDNLQDIVLQSFTVLFLGSVLFYRNWQLALIALGVLSLIAIPIYFISKKIRMLDHNTQRLNARLTGHIVETAMGIKVIKAFNIEGFQNKHYSLTLRQHFDNAMSIIKAGVLLKPLMQLISATGISIIVVIGTLRVLDGSMSLGEMTSFVTALLLLYKPAKTLGGVVGKVQRILSATERVFEKMDLKPEMVELLNATPIDQFNQLTFNNVSFSYETGKPVLNNINLTINQGEKVALVGSSGGGKTTLVEMIPRFMDPTEGRICVNGIDLREASLKELRQMISIVSQDTVVFTGTIRENITLGKLNATEEEIQSAIDAAYLRQWVDSLPDGLETEISERGQNVSGGQKQRLAIARAFIKNAPVLILDEATSALDNESEAKIQSALMELCQGKTVIIIAHRLSTVNIADRIIVMAKGQIVEEGTQAELLETGNTFQRLNALR